MPTRSTSSFAGRRLRIAPRALLLLALGAAPLCGVCAPEAAAQGKPKPSKPRPGDAVDKDKPDAAGKALELKRAGDDAMVSLRYGDALDAYAQAYALTSDPALLYNRGRAYQAMGQFADALDMLEKFDAQASAELRAKVPKLKDLLSDVRARVSTLTVTSNAPGVKVIVRSKVLGTAPLQVKLNAGPASIEVSADDYLTGKREVELPGGGAVTVDVPLQRKDTHGLLQVTTDPAGAFVSLGGKPVGTTPVEVAVDAGPVAISLHRDGYVDANASAVVTAGERREVSVSLEPVKPLTSKWWFWTGIGVIVIGGVALTAALLTEKSAGRGDIQPGQVAAPLLRF